MIRGTLTIDSGTGARAVALADYLEPSAEEQAHASEYSWIKGLRGIAIDGVPFRDAFTARGDSLWWFTELYLHKQQVVLDIFRAAAAARAMIAREQPLEIRSVDGSAVVRHVVTHVAAAGKVRGPRPPGASAWARRLLALDLRARHLTLSAHMARERRHPATPAAPGGVAAFVHRAFWRAGGEDGSAESYIGPVLRELEARIGAERLTYAGVGAPTNYRERRGARPAASSRVIDVERFAPLPALAASRAEWSRRYASFRRLTRCDGLRAAAAIQGIDCWPVIREELAGIAWLQWPWSVRAMDEAAAALDALRPDAVVTYAEAGGWGRALVLEARRRGIPSAGLQHGFIYRHWLNYRHEPDEMSAGATPPFPAPTTTLVFDDFAANHLRERGRFPAGAVQVAGSPRLDVLARELRQLPPQAVAEARRAARVPDDAAVVLVATKEREARGVLPRLLEAASTIPGAFTVIKPHPAETSGSYAAAAGGRPRVVVLDPSAPLAVWLAAASAVATVNSTVAIDAAVLDVPGLSIGLPNNLSPFVDAGAIAGANEPGELRLLLHRILYDDGFRQQLAEARRAMLGRHAIASDGRAAARCADAIDGLRRSRLTDKD